MTADPRILLGHIRGVHGIRGDVTLQTYTAEPEAIGDYGPLSDEAGRRTFEIKSVRMTGKGVIAHLKGVEDRTAAEALRGTALYVARSKLPPPTDGDYYHVDLIGLRAVDPAGQAIGRIVAVQNFGAGDLLEVRFDGASGTEFIPFTDACAPQIDIAGGQVVIIPPAMVEGDREDGDGGDRG
jgi:16S rRNA processing protein RimM